MKFFTFFTFLISAFSIAQVVNKTDSNMVKSEDSLIVDSGSRDSLKIFKPTIYDYKFQKEFGEKKYLDTVLSVDKSYIFSQYNNADNFGKVQFANIGSGFNPLMYQHNPEANISLLPHNKSYGILGIKDIVYYDVKTPTTMFVYHNPLRNGAALKSTYTQNIGKNFNFAVEYLGLRSQGFYRNSLAANNNTLFSAHYTAQNGTYEAFTHFLHQNVNNQEFGGIVRDDLYLAGDNSFNSKQNVQVNLANSSSQFSYRRYYLSHKFSPFDPEKFPFSVKHTIFHQGNKYFYNQSRPEDYYFVNDSELNPNYPASSKKFSKNLSNTVSLLWNQDNFKLEAGARHQLITLGINSGFILNGIQYPEKIQENRFGALGTLEISLWDKVDLHSFLEFSNGSEFGSFLRTANHLKFEPAKDYFLDVKANFQSSVPSFNFILNPSVYRRFNYYKSDFKNENILEIGGAVGLKWFKSSVFANYFRLENFAYFNSAGQPEQSVSSVNISQIGGDATFSYGQFNLNTKLQFQSVLSNKDLLPLPNFLGRANLFYQTKAFKNNAEIQTGIKTYFFSKFDSREYFPILNEYILPSSAFSIGGKPVVDAYFNLKVKRMFFFVEGQNVLEAFKTPIYSAPHYPLYDFRLNIGIVWYLIS